MIDAASSFFRGDLTREKFENLLFRLDADRNRAGEKYEEIRWKLIRFFQWSSCLHAEDCVDEAFNRVAEKLTTQSQEIQDVTAFIWGVAKRIRHEALRQQTKIIQLRDLPGGEEVLAAEHVAPGAQQELATQPERLKCLKKCIQSLSVAERKLLVAYHFPRGDRPEARRRLAQENGITMLALRVRANRLRFKLEECIKQRLSAQQDCNER